MLQGALGQLAAMAATGAASDLAASMPQVLQQQLAQGAEEARWAQRELHAARQEAAGLREQLAQEQRQAGLLHGQLTAARAELAGLRGHAGALEDQAGRAQQAAAAAWEGQRQGEQALRQLQALLARALQDEEAAEMQAAAAAGAAQVERRRVTGWRSAVRGHRLRSGGRRKRQRRQRRRCGPGSSAVKQQLQARSRRSRRGMQRRQLHGVQQMWRRGSCRWHLQQRRRSGLWRQGACSG